MPEDGGLDAAVEVGLIDRHLRLRLEAFVERPAEGLWRIAPPHARPV
jgi:hypothetical protein